MSNRTAEPRDRWIDGETGVLTAWRPALDELGRELNDGELSES